MGEVKLRIECEICGSYALLEEAPRNNICPVCLHTGSLFISEIIGEGHSESKALTHGRAGDEKG